MKRSEARVLLMQAVFQLEAQPEDWEKVFNRFIVRRREIDKNSKSYIKNTFKILRENLDDIDKKIEEHSKGWEIGRMAKVDLAILRVATCEITCDLDVPTAVAINEAVEMAKVYGTNESSKFVNGILGSISRAK